MKNTRSVILIGIILLVSVVVGFSINRFVSGDKVDLKSETTIFPSDLITTIPTIEVDDKDKKSILWGAYAGDTVSEVADFETKVGTSMNLLAVFIHWGNNSQFPVELAEYAKNHNQTLVIFWEALDYNSSVIQNSKFSYKDIIRGKWDTYLTSFAKNAGEYGNPIILIPFEEPNGNWYPWSVGVNGNTRQEHILAFQHIRGFFTTSPNVKFAWAVNTNSVPDIPETSIDNLYPGDEHVDYIGVNGFNFGSPWLSFSQLFDNSLTRLEKIDKPIFIFSVACAQGPAKASWISKALTIEIPKHPKIIGWIWFNENKEKDWRVWSDTNSLTAFKQIVSLMGH